MDFKVGDVVRVRSGGPPMTVKEIGEKSMTGEAAVWFDKVGNRQVPQEEAFSPAVLKKVEQDPAAMVVRRQSPRTMGW